MRQGWEQDYVEFVKARQASWHRQAFMLTGDAHRADDLVQQTCVDLFAYWKRAMAAADPKLTLPIPDGAEAADEISAASISDDGRTVMVTGSGAHIPVLWTCRP